MLLRIALFASGSGTNAENIVEYFSSSNNITVPIILSNRADAYVHERAKKLKLLSLTFSNEDFLNGKKVLNLLKQLEIDGIVLAGFLLKIPQNIINAYPQRIVNIHPALLPKYGGKGMYGNRVHKLVKEAGEKETGITIHYVNENYDDGDVIFQARCEINPTDTINEISDKVHELEYMYYPPVVEKLFENGFGIKSDDEQFVF